MKKISIFLFGSLLCLTVPFITSCDEGYPGPDPVDVTANYSNKFSNPTPNLTLTYNGENMTGKSVDFSTVKGETANITLYDIIPGEKAFRLTSIPLIGNADYYTFKGNGTSTDTEATFNYEGHVEKGKLEIHLTEVKMGDSNLWANNYIFPTVANSSDYKITAGPAYVDTEMAPGTEDGYNSLLRGVLSYFLPQLLNSVTLKEDGNIIVGYSTDPILLMGKPLAEFMEEMGNMSTWQIITSKHLQLLLRLLGGTVNKSDIDLVTAERTFQQSPTHLAYWSKKGDIIMVKLNLPAIITQIMKNNGKTVDENLVASLYDAIQKVDAIQIKSILIKINGSMNNTLIRLLTDMDDNTFRQVVSWITDGIPMHLERVEEHTYLFVDKETLLPLLNLLPKLTPMIMDMLANSVSETLYGTLEGIVKPMLDKIAVNWPASQRFNIGLDLILNTNE